MKGRANWTTTIRAASGELWLGASPRGRAVILLAGALLAALPLVADRYAVSVLTLVF